MTFGAPMVLHSLDPAQLYASLRQLSARHSPGLELHIHHIVNNADVVSGTANGECQPCRPHADPGIRRCADGPVRASSIAVLGREAGALDLGHVELSEARVLSLTESSPGPAHMQGQDSGCLRGRPAAERLVLVMRFQSQYSNTRWSQLATRAAGTSASNHDSAACSQHHQRGMPGKPASPRLADGHIPAVPWWTPGDMEAARRFRACWAPSWTACTRLCTPWCPPSRQALHQSSAGWQHTAPCTCGVQGQTVAHLYILIDLDGGHRLLYIALRLHKSKHGLSKACGRLQCIAYLPTSSYPRCTGIMSAHITCWGTPASLRPLSSQPCHKAMQLSQSHLSKGHQTNTCHLAGREGHRQAVPAPRQLPRHSGLHAQEHSSHRQPGPRGSRASRRVPKLRAGQPGVCGGSCSCGGHAGSRADLEVHLCQWQVS